MQKKENRESRKKSLFTTKKLVFMSLMIAMSIVLGKYLVIFNTDIIRISLENLPIIFTSVVLGPLSGILVAVLADLLGCVLVGFTVNPTVTLGALFVALISGLLCGKLPIKSILARLTISVLSAHLIGSVTIKTIGLASWYLAKYDMGFGALFSIRLLVYLLTGIAEIAVISILLNSKSLKKLILKIQGA